MLTAGGREGGSVAVGRLTFGPHRGPEPHSQVLAVGGVANSPGPDFEGNSFQGGVALGVPDAHLEK
jgi:hypothetical protein